MTRTSSTEGSIKGTPYIPPSTETFKAPQYFTDPETGLVSFSLVDNGPVNNYTKENSIKVYANPTSFSEKHEPQYSKRGPLGLSHEVPQYIRTNSREVSFEVWVAYEIMVQRGFTKSHLDPLHLRRFFQSLTVPLGRRMAPPTVEVIWPSFELNLKGKCSACSFTYQRFANNGKPLEYTANLTFLEIGTGLMTSKKVYENGMGYAAMEPSTDIGQ
jgi:hypothetical protein